MTSSTEAFSLLAKDANLGNSWDRTALDYISSQKQTVEPSPISHLAMLRKMMLRQRTSFH